MSIDQSNFHLKTTPLDGKDDKSKDSNDDKNPISLDEVLKNELGEFGNFQLRNILLLTIPIVLSGFRNEYVFTAAAIPHRCQIPECDENNNMHTYNTKWILNAVPETNSGFSSCVRYAPIDFENNGTLEYCPARFFNHSQTIACEGFVYANNNTVVYEFDLGCQEWLRVLAGTFNSIGILIGLPITGYISDRFGRRIALVLNAFNLGLIAIIRSFSVNYAMYVGLQMTQTILGASVYTSAFILAAELIGPKYRVLISATLMSMYSMGQVVLGGIAWIIDYWRYLTITLGIPCLFMFVYYWLLSESFRWLLSKKKYAQARRILEAVARVNKKTISEDSMEAILNPPQVPHIKVRKFGLVRTVFRSSILLRRACTTPILWIAGTFVYYGLSINSVSLSSTKHLSYMLTGAVEIPGIFAGVLFLDRIGRRGTLSSGFLFSALCNIIFIFLPNDMITIRLITYLLGKFGISMVMSALYLYTSELYPTEFRQTFVAFSSMIGRLGTIAAPLTPVFTQYWYGLPSAMFSGMGVLAGVLVLSLPETLGTKLPDTLSEAEILGKSYSNSKINT